MNAGTICQKRLECAQDYDEWDAQGMVTKEAVNVCLRYPRQSCPVVKILNEFDVPWDYEDRMYVHHVSFLGEI